MGPPRALTIAGTDSGGGAGVVADVKTFTAHGVWALCAVTAVTVQNTMGVTAVAPIDPAVVAAQVEAVAGDIGVDAAKTGMLASAATVVAVAGAVRGHRLRLVVDPVVATSTGEPLLGDGGVEALRDALLPLASVVTPNLAEAAALAGFPVETEDDMERAAAAIAATGARAVVVTGGHLAGDAVDVLWIDGRAVHLRGARLDAAGTHGTGCVFSAAVTARLARGEEVEDAVRGAKDYVTRALAAGVSLGRGLGAVNPPREPA